MRGVLLAIGVFLLWPAPSRGQTFTPNPALYYQLQARHSNKCLDVKDFSPGNGAPMQQWDCNWPQANQLFVIEAAGGGTFRIASGVGAKCLDIPWSSTANGTVAQQYECNLATFQPNQVFQIVPAPTAGYYRIYAAHTAGSPKCLDVQDVSLSNGAPVQQYDCGPSHNANQDWHMVISSRVPRSHIQAFGYFGASSGESNPYYWAANDHQNMAVIAAWDSNELAKIPQVLANGVKVNLNVGGEFFRIGPRRDDYYANQPCPDPANPTPTTCDGGILPDYHTRWAVLREQIRYHVNNGSIKMVYLLDEPYWNFYLQGFTDSEAYILLSSAAADIKADFPNLPIAVVESTPKAGMHWYPPNIDWIGFGCYECNYSYYMSLHNATLAHLEPHQRLIVVAPAYAEKSPNPNCIPSGSDPCPDPWTNQPGSLDVPVTRVNELVDRAHFYMNVALSEPRTVAMLVWHGESRPFYGDKQVLASGLIVGAFDMPTVKAKWRFLARALGFGHDIP